MAAKPTKDSSKDAKTEDTPTSHQYHGELQNTDAKNFSGGNDTAPVYNDVPQAPGFDPKAAKADE